MACTRELIYYQSSGITGPDTQVLVQVGGQNIGAYKEKSNCAHNNPIQSFPYNLYLNYLLEKASNADFHHNANGFLFQNLFVHAQMQFYKLGLSCFSSSDYYCYYHY